jgi:hypothetical protein
MRAPSLPACRPAALVAAGVLAAASPRPAAAAPGACAIAVDGDATAAQIRQELLSFPAAGDDPCIPLRVTCARQEQQVVINFTDELGRYVERRFDSPAGAAAFLISWSRRPIGEARPAASAPSAARWQPAVGYALFWVSGVNHGSAMLSASITRHDTDRQPHRYFGLGVRYQEAVSGLDLSLIYGLVRNSHRALQRLEVRAGLGDADFPTGDEYLTTAEVVGLSAGIRGALGVELVDDIDLELSAGADLLFVSPDPQLTSLPEHLGFQLPLFLHVGAQLRWGAIR